MLKYENIAKVGERIRAYDFQWRKDCYVEGVVQRITDEHGFLAFAILVDVDEWPRNPKAIKGQEVVRSGGGRIGTITFVPMECAFLEYDGRIENLTSNSPVVPRRTP